MIGSLRLLRKMPRRLLIGLLPMAAICLAACDPTQEYQYYKEGIGTEVVRDGSAGVTTLQDLYLSELCRQAGIVPIGASDGCWPAGASPNWGLIVLAGMNDIDARCDSYLAWLDDKRRSQEPILSEINVLQTTTQSMMRVAGAGANPITMVGLAFGLASNTFTNIRSRLLLEANHSTVQSIVLGRQKDYRIGFAKQTVITRAEAVYALRSYLRICMPMTIEMQINTTVAIFEQVGTDGLQFKQDHPLIDPRTITGRGGGGGGGGGGGAGSGSPLTSGQQVAKPVRPTPPSLPDLSSIATPDNKLLVTQTDLQNLQDTMCGVPKSERGKVGNFTLANMHMFKVNQYPRKTNPRRAAKLDQVETVAITGSGPCPSKARNYYEKLSFPDGPVGQEQAQQLAKDLNKAEPENPLDVPKISNIDDVRGKIASVRPKLDQTKLESYPVDVSSQVTPDFWTLLR